MSVRTNAGTTLAIGSTQTNALTDVYTSVGEVRNIGDFGRVYNQIEHSVLSDRNVQKFKGQRDDGTLEVELGYDAADTGQAALKTALDSDSDYNIRITLNDASSVSGSHGTLFHMKAKVMQEVKMLGDANNIVRSKVVLAIKSGSITETPAT